MPVIQLSLEYLRKNLPKIGEKEIIESLPYLGLDIEAQEGENISVEYSPNRPDYSSQAGIVRSLRGLLGVETGCPRYHFEESNSKVFVEDDEIRKFRPFISAFLAQIRVTDELIRELITMQEDLTNGIGRRRSKVAIGIHNAEVIKPPIRYFATSDENFSFVPLYGIKRETIGAILKETVQGREYSHLLSSGIYPVLEDSSKNVLSMPPIINGELTRLKPGIDKLFFDVTSTDEEAGDCASAIMAAMLSDAGAEVRTVQIESVRSRSTPDMSEKKMHFDTKLTNKILGLSLSPEQCRNALAKSRLTLDDSGETAIIPAFRADIIHPVDLCEEVELGYGVANLTGESAYSALTGSILPSTKVISKVVEVMVGLGMTEIFNLSLTNKMESALALKQDLVLKIDDPKSESFEYLKSEILPSLLGVLGSSTHEEYPQKIFEIAPIFKKGGQDVGVLEEQHLAAALADSAANFTAIKSIIQGLFRLIARSDSKVRFAPSNSGGVFAQGRSASIVIETPKSGTSEIGIVGEISPNVLEEIGLKVPAAAFEIDLGWLLEEPSLKK